MGMYFHSKNQTNIQYMKIDLRADKVNHLLLFSLQLERCSEEDVSLQVSRYLRIHGITDLEVVKETLPP